MGFMEGRIAVDHDNGVYYPGQTVFGKVIFDQGKVKTFRGIYVVVKGFCKVHWTSTHTRRVNDRDESYTKVHESYEEYFEKKIYLIGGKSGETQLVAGHYEFPFECHLPTNLPSSYEGSVGHIRYRVQAVVDRAFKFDQELFFTLRVMSPVDLNSIANAKNPIEFEMEHTYCCWCVSSGSSEVLIKVPTTGFCVGRAIPVEVSCTNNSNVEIDTIRLTIKKDTIFRATSEPDTKTERDKLAELAKGPVPPRSSRNWTLDVHVPEMDVYNLNACRFIDMDHYFRVDIETSGCHQNTDETRRIYFGNVPLASEEVGFVNPMHEAHHIPPTQYQPIINQPMPYPGVTYPSQPPNVTPYPYPGQYPSNPGFNNPGFNQPYPAPSPVPGFAPGVPMLPPGAAVPIGRPNPFSSASAPEPPTPTAELNKK